MTRLNNSKLSAILFILFISIAAEIFLFNFRYFQEIASGAPQIEIKASGFSVKPASSINSNGLTVTDKTSFCINDPGVAVNSLKFNTANVSSFTVSVSYLDENFSTDYVNAGMWTVDPAVESTKYVRFITSGKCTRIKFNFSDTVGVPIISSVVLNSPYFHFNIARVILLFLILSIIYSLCDQRLWDKRLEHDRYDRYDLWNIIFTVYIIAAFISIILCFDYGSLQTFSQDPGTDEDCYRLLTEAFSHGKLSFLKAPPEQLMALSNPYDPSLRNFNYIFDSAYYNGHYYCYFGIAPVITLLLPFKLLTGLYMPTPFACLIYMLAMLFAVLLLYNNIVLKWFRNTGLLQFIGGAIAVVFSANLFWLIARPMFYELAVLSALFYLFMGFALLIHASDNAAHPVLCLFFSGLCFSLMVASRPNFIFYLAAVLPLLIPLILHKKHFASKPAAAFFTPLAVFAVILMAYNYARFGSPFNFGQRYQLTVSDVHYNSATNFAVLPVGLFHYFFAPLKIDMTYPFFHVVQTTPAASCGYYYNQPMAGLFNYPLILTILAAFYILKRMPQERKSLKRFTAILLFMSLAVTYLDITMAGVLERYTLDIGPVLVFVSVILWFEIIEYFKQKGAQRPVTKLFFAVCTVSSIISMLCCSIGEYSVQKLSNPQLYERLAAIFEFWR